MQKHHAKPLCMSPAVPMNTLRNLHRPLRVACLGEAMVELSDLSACDGRVAMGFAGDTLNCAIYLSRLLQNRDVEVSYLTALGIDQFSDRMMAFMASERIGTADIARFAAKLPGIYAIELDDKGERSFRYWRSQSAARAMLDEGGLTDETVQGYDVLVLSAISLAILPLRARQRLIGLCAAMGKDGKIVVFDSNYRPALWSGEAEAREWISAMWAAATIGLPSRDDEAKLWPDEVPEALCARLGLSEIALKDGATGPWLWDGVLQPKEAYPSADKVVDTTSAGDSFNAGYVAARLTGQSPQEAALVGHQLACTVIGHKGAIIPQEAMPALL